MANVMDKGTLTDKQVMEMLGRKVAERRLGMQMSQKELSEASKVALNSVINLEKGENISLKSLIRILRELNAMDLIMPELSSVNELAAGYGEPVPESEANDVQVGYGDQVRRRVRRRRLSASSRTIVSKIRPLLEGLPIEKAWVFGPFAKGEENANNSFNILIKYIPDATKVDIAKLKKQLNMAAGCRFKLFEEGALLPSDNKSADKDKVLIYEKGTSISETGEDRDKVLAEGYRAFKKIRALAEAGKLPDLSLEEINQEIKQARNAKK
jgi:predicted nucleotidyltransferase/DNA-binding XRE family transcriptional regulator